MQAGVRNKFYIVLNSKFAINIPESRRPLFTKKNKITFFENKYQYSNLAYHLYELNWQW